MKSVTSSILFLFFTFCIIIVFSQASPITITDYPQPNLSFKPNQTQHHQSNSCSYTVTITTSCNSPSFTRDRISLSFGDAYGYQVYVPKLDDPSSRTFERCSTDTFNINGPCTYPICYLYLYRSGYDGWKPESVTVYTHNYQPATFYYNAFIPNGVWYGFDYCRGYLPSTATATAAAAAL
ncbi:putative PLAT/LH2 domain-containing protein [Medicago truncatula]|uniref:Embryo-specific 3 n=1 Tax=Medicago truncatula TaxID=3880 RepID=Q2HUA9_MEDTR|nr:embryo-specific protein ATS3A [Medicago truncatula]ABD28725.1 Embryo-specific 3 [Medicago truncatula]AES68139.1 embryo-specific protein [Medicago truncatula]AFK39815.1 unknown [Medicago truncatula]RHN76515.1 putative PLAT/LH2 domain-containing protein [Medicago truncatula]